MPILSGQGVFALSAALGVSGLVSVLSLLLACACEETALLALAACLATLVAAPFLWSRWDSRNTCSRPILRVAPPAPLAGLLPVFPIVPCLHVLADRPPENLNQLADSAIS